jgi:predicted ATPase
MLDYINLENFKSIVKAEIRLAQINLVIGVNRTGKSSILQSVAVLKQSMQEPVSWNGPFVSLGDYNNVLSKKASRDEIVMQIGGQRMLSESTRTFLGGTESVVRYGLHVGVGRDRNKMTIGIKIESGPISISRTIQSSIGHESSIALGDFKVNLRDKFQVQNPFEVSGSGHPPDWSHEKTQQAYDAMYEILNVIQNHLEQFVFVPTTRGFDKPDYVLLDNYTGNIPSSEGLTRQAEIAASNLAYREDLAREIANLIRRILPDIEDIAPKLIAGKRVQVATRDSLGQYSLMNEGFGVNQLIYLFHQLKNAKPNATIFVEEPEIALHPSAQSAIASTLVDVALHDHKQLIITTHSEHVILSMLEEVAAGRLQPHLLKVYYLEKQGGVTEVMPLEVNERGELKGGLKGFFEADMEHLRKFLTSMEEKPKSG